MKPFALVHPRRSPRPRACRSPADAELKAGGVDLLDRMKEGLDSPKTRRLDRARSRASTGSRPGRPARIGALATLAQIADARRTSAGATPRSPTRPAGAATPQIRNMATLGGNLCQRPRCWYYRLEEFDCRKKGGSECFARDGENRFHAIFDTDLLCCCVHPSATGTALLAYGATLEIVSPKGKRTICRSTSSSCRPTDDATRENTLGPGEIIEAVAIPAPAGRRALGLPEAQGEGDPSTGRSSRPASRLTIAGGVVRDAARRPRLGRADARTARRRRRRSSTGGAPGAGARRAGPPRRPSRGAKPLAQNAYKVRLARSSSRGRSRQAWA